MNMQTRSDSDEGLSDAGSLLRLKITYIAFCVTVVLASIPVSIYALNNTQAECIPIRTFSGLTGECLSYAEKYPFLWLMIIFIEIFVMGIIFHNLSRIYKGRIHKKGL